MKFLKAIKKGYVMGKEAHGGERVVTFNAEGVETVNTAKCGEIIVSVTNKNGDAIIQNGHPNTWIVRPDVFNNKYILSEKPGMYRSRGEQMFVVLESDIEIIAPWREIQKLKKHDLLNITNFSDIYGISAKEFYDTYNTLEFCDIYGIGEKEFESNVRALETKVS